MARRKTKDSKHDALRKGGALHPHPEGVTDDLFRTVEFFDPRDFLQVKYEMLRRVRLEGLSIQRTAHAFGLSRPSFYKALQDFEREGMQGLLPAKKGPQRAHKLSHTVMEFVAQQLENDPSLNSTALADFIETRFHFKIHPRSIERALERSEKKTP